MKIIRIINGIFSGLFFTFLEIIEIICRIFVGAVFIFSGFVKAIDPLGSAYKFIDYFVAFGMDWAEPFAFSLAVILSALEFVIGISLFLGIKVKLNSWGALIFMVAFTPLTFILALYDPVQDCGCFGDAIILTNWQTFWKNIIILIPTIIIFISRKKFRAIFNNITNWSIIGAFSIIIIGVSIYCYQHLPFFDFRPYKAGIYIPDGMIIPEDAPHAIYENYIYYKKDGVVKEFTMDNLPDSTWEWVESKSILIQQGYIPPIHDFAIYSVEGDDITDLVLEDENYSFILVAYDLKKSGTSAQEQINELAEYCNKNDYLFICITSSIAEDIENFKNLASATYDFYNMDDITLKTIIRSNPGLVLLKKGTIMGKCHYNDIPAIKELTENYLGL